MIYKAQSKNTWRHSFSEGGFSPPFWVWPNEGKAEKEEEKEETKEEGRDPTITDKDDLLSDESDDLKDVTGPHSERVKTYD